MHVSKLLGSLFADQVAMTTTRPTSTSKREFVELPISEEFIEECIKYLKSQDDYKDFKITIFKYLSSKRKAFKNSDTFKEYYPELFI